MDMEGGLLQESFPLQVKNTFIAEEGLDDEDIDAFQRRQVSAPAACASFLPQSSLGQLTTSNPVQTSLLDELNATWNKVEDEVPGKNNRKKSDDSAGSGDLPPEPMRISSGYGAPVMPAPAAWENTTTIMMRNLPNKYTQRMLLTEVNQTGFLGTFDFMYLPMDPETNANRGYAFLNFIDSGFAWMFKMSYEGRKMNRFNSSKVVSVMPATLQGFDANYAHYSSARVNRGDPSARPLFLREPSQPVKAQAGKGAGKQRNNRRSPGNEYGNYASDQSSVQQTPDFFAQQALFAQTAMTAMQPTPSPWPEDPSFTRMGGLEQKQPEADTGEKTLVPKFCPHCGGPIQPRFQFCPHCGNAISFANLGREI